MRTVGKKFGEDSRVKIPALMHFTRLGYRYRSLKEIRPYLDFETNINKDALRAALERINELDEALTDEELKSIVTKLSDSLTGEDLGRAFFQKLRKGVECRGESLQLIDYDYICGNDFEVVTELPCLVDANTEVGSFRPDITVFINGLPLAFCEVKIPNNRKGMKAEYDRMNERTENAKYRRFLNITQMMLFSNNMEYDDTGN